MLTCNSMSNSLFQSLDNHYQQQLEQKVYALLSHAEHFFQRKFPIPEISFRLRGSNAGLALLRSNQLRFNNQLLLVHGQSFINETAAHELAHLIAYQLHGLSIRPHGTEWQRIMVEVFDSKPSVTHSYRTSMNRKEVYLYQCLCPKLIQFSKVRHKRAQRGSIYRCRLCQASLSFQGKRSGRKSSAKSPVTEALQKQLPFV